MYKASNKREYFLFHSYGELTLIALEWLQNISLLLTISALSVKKVSEFTYGRDMSTYSIRRKIKIVIPLRCTFLFIHRKEEKDSLKVLE